MLILKKSIDMNLKKILPYIAALGIFVMASLVYFHPVLKGEQMVQSDITQFRGMAKEIQDYRAETGQEPYWTGSAFSGMPAFQLSAYYPHDYIDALDRAIRFLPRPADYVFLYFLSFFVLLSALKVEWKLSVLGALAFGFSTYLIIIFGAGHNAKAHAIGYMPLVLAGIIWVFRKKYLLGFVVTALAMALELKANHPQMTYYLGFSAILLGLGVFVDLVRTNMVPVYKESWKQDKALYARLRLSLLFVYDMRRKVIPFVYKEALIILLATILGLGMNSTRLMAMKEYGDASTRGPSELTLNADGSEKEVSTGLNRGYITQFSYGIAETFNLMVPKYMGGGTIESLHEDSHTHEFVASIAGKKQADQFTKQVFTYWGDQTIIEAPAYIGAVVFFMFFLGLFTVKGRYKYWVIGTVVIAILLSWGKNFSLLTDYFIDHVPLYNKFRAVTSIQVIAELCVPVLAILGVKEFFAIEDSEKQIAVLKKAAYVCAGILLLGLIYAFTGATFEGLRDGRYKEYQGLLEAIIADRKAMLYSDTFRSFVLVAFTAGMLWLYAKRKLDQTKTIVLVGILLLFDLLSVNINYVNADDFEPSRRVSKPFQLSNADKQILKDKGHYRVANLSVNMMQDGSTSYFHKSVGGYHAAKMRRYDELIDYQFTKNNIEVFNMLNTKYFIYGKHASDVRQNPGANGNAWFVQGLKVVQNADQEIRALDSLPTKTLAVVDVKALKAAYPNKTTLLFAKDSTASIALKKYSLTELSYESKAQSDQFAVFSEIYYGQGWNAYLNGALVPHARVNYVLRGMHVPAGDHQITFKFEPTVIEQGKFITLGSYALLLLIPVGWFFISRRKV